MADGYNIDELRAAGLSEADIAALTGFNLADYQADYQRRQAEIQSKDAASLAAAQKAGISNIGMYDNAVGAGEIIPGSTANIMAGLGIYNPQYQAVMRTYGSQTDRDNENDVTERSTFAVDPNASYRLVDGKGNVIGSTASGDSIRSLVDAANEMSSSQGQVANWTIEKAGYGDSWQSVATDRPDYGTFDKIAGAALPIVVSMIPGLQGVGAVLAQAAAGGAGSAISGGDPLKGAVVGGLTAAGSEFLGPYIQGVKTTTQAGEAAKTVATNLGSAVGAGAGSFAGNIATGQSLKNSLINAGVAGLSDYLMGELSGRDPEYDELMKFARDQGIYSVDLGDGTYFDFARGVRLRDGVPVTGGIGSSGGGSTGAGGSTDGGIDVTGTRTGGTTAGIGTTGAINVTGTRTGDNTQDTTGGTPTTVVTAQNAGDTKVDDKGTPTTVVTAQGDGKTGETGSDKDTSATNIDVTAKDTGDTKTDDKGTPTTVVTAKDTGDNKTDDKGTPTTVVTAQDTGDTKTDDKDKEPPPGDGEDKKDDKDGDKKKWTWKDWARLGLLAPTLIKGLGDLLDGGDGTEVITPDQSRVSFTPMNRERGIGSFDPFTYGQAGPGKQTAEFEFFKPAQIAPVTQTYTPATVQTVGGTPRYQYTQEQVDALNAATMNTYNQNLARFNAYQDDLAKQVEAGTLTLDQAIKQANTFGAGLGGVAPVTAAEGGLIELPDELSGFIDEYTGLNIGTDEYRKLSKQDRTLLRNYDIQRRKLQAEQQRKSIAENEAKRLAREAAQPYFARGDIDRELYEQTRQAARAEQTAARKAAQDSVRAEYSPLIDAARAEREAAAARNASLYGDLNNASISSALNKAMYAQGASEDARLAAQRELSSPMLYGQRDIRGGADIGDMMNVLSRYTTPEQLNAALDVGGRKGRFMPFNSYNAGITESNAALNDILSRYTQSLQDVRSQYSKPLTFDWPTVGQMKAATGMAEGGEMNDDMVKHLMEYRKGGGHHGPGPVNGIGSGQEDKIPAWLSDGEYVWSAQDVADLGDGSTNEGVRRLDKMRQMVRKRAGRKNVKKIAKPQQGIEQMLKAVGSKA
jgi:hypothetical protein